MSSSSSWFLPFVINPYSFQNTWPSDSVSRVRILARKRTHLVILGEHTLCPNSLFHRQTISPCLVRPGTTTDLQNRPVEHFDWRRQNFYELGKIKVLKKFTQTRLYLTCVFSSIRISCTYHSFGDVHFLVRDPKIADFSVQNRNLNFVDS